MSIIERILQTASDKGISNAFICGKIGVNRTWLNAAKRDNLNISDDRLHQIATVLGTTAAYLKGETDDPSPENKKSPSELDELLNDPDFKFIFEAYRDMSPEKKKQARALFSTVKNEF